MITLTPEELAHLRALDEIDPPPDLLEELAERIEVLEAQVAELRGGAPKASPLDLAARLVDETFGEGEP